MLYSMKELFVSFHGLDSKDETMTTIQINDILLEKIKSCLVFEKTQMICLNNDGCYYMYSNNDSTSIVKAKKEVSKSSMFDCETNTSNIRFYMNQYKTIHVSKEYIPNDSVVFIEDIKTYRPYLKSPVKMQITQTYSTEDIHHLLPIHKQISFNIEDKYSEDETLILDDMMHMVDMCI